MKDFLKDTYSLSVMGIQQKMISISAKTLLAIGLSIGTLHAASAEPTPKLSTNAPNTYIVKSGDTLWDIAGMFLKSPSAWPKIWADNRNIKNPNLIYPGDKLLLCKYKGNTPLVGKDMGDGCKGVIARYTNSAQPNEIRLKPQVRIQSYDDAIPVIPLKSIQVWLDRAVILPSEALKDIPYVVGSEDNHLMAGVGQKIYVRGNGIQTGQYYGIYQPTSPYILKDNNGKDYNAGNELTQTAKAVATQVSNDIATLEIVQSYNQEVRLNNLVLPEKESRLPNTFVPTTQNITGGSIIRVLGSIGAATKNSVVTVNLGELDGLKSGQIFNISQPGKKIKDSKSDQTITLPSEKAGSLLIFKTFDHLSYAYVLESYIPIKVGSNITTPNNLED